MAPKKTSQDKGMKSKGASKSTSAQFVGDFNGNPNYTYYPNVAVLGNFLIAAERTAQAQKAFDEESQTVEGLMKEISNANPTYLTVTNEEEARTAREYAQTNQWRGDLYIIAKNGRLTERIKKRY
ncbi:hypothetical protein RHMOL_Rhmol02G0228100 [Rhododendron molle]|uniref:Uncharacterized protein n=1 Tax=Rhododendron molle TaxID=49168 RepID=A0ACC0PUR0_RHOML|nr:hypothetical protein RHMOL_Rhmol02G0228100 [Rhododendron molle]